MTKALNINKTKKSLIPPNEVIVDSPFLTERLFTISLNQQANHYQLWQAIKLTGTLREKMVLSLATNLESATCLFDRGVKSGFLPFPYPRLFVRKVGK
jgi:hypothetical protein